MRLALFNPRVSAPINAGSSGSHFVNAGLYLNNWFCTRSEHLFLYGITRFCVQGAIITYLPRFIAGAKKHRFKYVFDLSRGLGNSITFMLETA